MVTEWHRWVPRALGANLAWRRRVLEQCRVDGTVRRAVRELCRRDLLFFINTFVWQFNPRAKQAGEVGPFITWDFQEEALLKEPGQPWREPAGDLALGLGEAGILWCMEHDEDLLIEKSREMGASWLCLIVMLWRFLFYEWQTFLCISRSEAMVDCPKPQSLFWKVDFILDRLPEFLKGAIERGKCYFGHANGSTITGEASTARAGVGGRFTAMFIDEFSQIKEGYEVLHRTSDSTGCRIFNGTHKGTATAFHELSQRVDMKKLVLHWTRHPVKRVGLYYYDKESGRIVILDREHVFPLDYDFQMIEAPLGGPHPGVRSPWYDKECPRKGSDRAVAEDLDIDPSGSAAQFFDPLRIRHLRERYGAPPTWEGDVVYDRTNGQFEGLVPALGGPLKLWRCPRADGRLAAGRYALGGDVATGSGATNSCLSGAEAETREKVLEYATPHVLPEKFALVCVALGGMLATEDGEPALLCWESKGPGLIVGRVLQDVGYPNLYRRQRSTPAGYTGPTGAAYAVGWDPAGSDAKRQLLETYRMHLYQERFINRSLEAMSAREILQYRYNAQGNVEHPHDVSSADPTGARINHGDRVIADALCDMMLDYLGRMVPRASGTIVRPLSLAWRRQLADNTPSRPRAWID